MAPSVQIAARAVQLACRRFERAGSAVELGADLGACLTRHPGTRAAARAQGLLWGDRLTLAGLRLLDGERAEHAAARARRAAEEQAELERLQQEQRAAQERAAVQLAALRYLDALVELRVQLRSARDELDGLDASPAGLGVCHLGVAAAEGQCAGAGPRKLPWCDARWSAQAIAPRHQPILRYLPGGAERKPSPAAVKARLAFERERALGKLALAARRFVGFWGWTRGSIPLAGMDLGPSISSTRKGARHARPLFAMGLLTQPTMVLAGAAPAILTAAGAAWLREQQVRAAAA